MEGSLWKPHWHSQTHLLCKFTLYLCLFDVYLNQLGFQRNQPLGPTSDHILAEEEQRPSGPGVKSFPGDSDVQRILGITVLLFCLPWWLWEEAVANGDMSDPKGGPQVPILL